ncbi:MAG: hypothetical protein HZB50_10415 [Chloroflexi bacterium]|nr:hypothetical protein [Chloroflexota bacterium]
MENLSGTTKPRVLVISRCESLLGIAVESLAVDEKDWMVLRIYEGEITGDLVEKVKELDPGIVIIPQSDTEIEDPLFMRILQDCVGIQKMISFSLQENTLEVYCKRKIQVKSSQDLFSEVDNQLINICPEAKQPYDEKKSTKLCKLD